MRRPQRVAHRTVTRVSILAILSALAVVAPACTPPDTPTPAPVIEVYGGQSFEFREGVRYGAQAVQNKYDVWLPLAGAPARPLVVFIHGGFWATQDGGDRKTLPPQVKALLLSGYAVASIDYRGVTQTCYASTPCSQPAILGDVKDAIGQLAHNEAPSRVINNKVHLVGFSAGGHLALMAAMTFGDPGYPSGSGLEVRPTTVTSIAGPTDLEQLWADSPGNLLLGAALTNYGGGYQPNNPVHSPVSQTAPNLGRTDPPINLLYGTNDELVPYNQATRMVSAANSAGIPVTLTTVGGVNHDGMRLQVNTANLATWLAAH